MALVVFTTCPLLYIDQQEACFTGTLNISYNMLHCPFAGVIGLPRKDGVDQQLRINHYGPFLLTSLLLPQLAKNARIVNVASRAHQQGSLKIKNGAIQGTPSHW